MPYVEAITVAGDTIEVERYYTNRYRQPGTRSKKVKATSETQEKINNKQAEKKLRRLINNNFGAGDYHLVLDYIRKSEIEDRTPEEMKKDIAIFLRESRKEYKKAGLEFRYIHVMEIGERGARHHHLIVNHIDVNVLQRAWHKAYSGHNRIKVFPLDDSGNYSKLASYLIKYTSKHLHDPDRLIGKRYSCSRNLSKPVTKKKIITARSWLKEPKAKKGYVILKDTIESGMTSAEYYGYGYLRYMMVRQC